MLLQMFLDWWDEPEASDSKINSKKCVKYALVSFSRQSELQKNYIYVEIISMP